MKMINKNDNGFTIVELLLAMAIFSFVMVTMVVAFTQIMRSYRQGVASQRTQEATRELSDVLTKEARSAGDVLAVQADDQSVLHLCFDSGLQVDFNPTQRLLTKGQKNGNCTSNATNSEPFLSSELRAVRFDVEVIDSPNDIVLGINLDVVVVTNNEDEDGNGSLLDETGQACDASQAGAHFCSTSRLVTSIGLRGKGVNQ